MVSFICKWADKGDEVYPTISSLRFDDDDDVVVDDDIDVDEFKLKLKTFNAKIKSLYGKKVELVVGNAKKSNEKIIWEVINDHCPTEALDYRSKTYLGI
jgi:hypothetical protein